MDETPVTRIVDVTEQPEPGETRAQYQARMRELHGLPSTLIREGETAWEASRRMRAEREAAK